MSRALRGALVAVWMSTFTFAGLSAQAAPRLEIGVDPGVELLSIVQFLANRMDNHLQTRYAADVRSWFGPYRGDPAVALAQALIPDGSAWAVPATLGTALGPLPQFEPRDTLPTALRRTPVPRDSVAIYVRAIRAFAARSGFSRFFALHRPFYDSLAARTRSTLGNGDSLIAVVEGFWGLKASSYRIWLSPLMPAGGVGPSRHGPNGEVEIIAVLGATGLDQGHPLFGSRSALRRLVLHEFSHHFVNPMVEEFGAETDRWGLLLVPVQNRLRQADGLFTWRAAVQELLIRAFTTNIAAQEQGDSVARSILVAEQELGFEYLPAITVALTEYRNARDRYPNFRAFYPRLLALFSDLAGSGLGPEHFQRPFEGTIAMARWHDENMFWVFILPSDEGSPGELDSLTDLVRLIRTRTAPRSFIISDEEALRMDLNGYALQVWGTPAGNRWLRAHPEVIPAKILPDRIVTDTTIFGDSLVFVTAVPSPIDSTKPLLVTTGQRFREVSRSWWVWDREYVVMEGAQVRDRGTYRRGAGAIRRFGP